MNNKLASKKISPGMSSVEILIALTILIVLMAGINTILITRAKINQYHRDTVIANNIVQKALDSIKNQSSDLDFYLSLNKQIETNISNPPFSVIDISPQYRNQFVGLLTVQEVEAVTTKDTTPGNNVIIFIDKMPTKIGISIGSSVIIYNRINGVTETVFIRSLNDSSMHIGIDDTSPQNGRQGLQNSFPKGSVVIANGKAIKIEIYYANPMNVNIRDITRKSPLASVTTILSFPFPIK